MAAPMIRRTLADRIIEYFDPVRGRERMQARAMMAVAGQWLGGRLDRRPTKNWLPYAGSADSDLLWDLPYLRRRSRDLVRNNPLALGAINTAVTSVVGTGLSLRARIDAAALGLTANEAQDWQRTTEREFRLWAENPGACDAARTLDFYQQQSLAVRSALESGDVFAVLPMVQRKESPYALKVQLIEADRIVNKDYARDSETLAGGVQMDQYGAPIAYHIMRKHPGGLSLAAQMQWDIVPAFGKATGRRNVIHLFDKRRPGQTRGYPYLAPVIEALKQLGDYTEAEITAAVISGMFTVFVQTEGGSGLDAGDDGAGVAAADAKAGSEIKMGSGAIVDLAPGESVNFANPGRPNQAFDPFVTAILRQIGVALEIPFEVLVKHFTASYSAARAAMLEAWRFFKGRRAWLAAMFCQPIYETWLEEAVALGRIDAPGFLDDPAIRASYCGAEWIGDSPGQIDPLKEVQAAERRLALLLTTHADEAASMHGADWDDIIARRAREEELIASYGLKPAPIPPDRGAAQPSDAAPTQTPPDNGDQENGDLETG